MLPARLTLGDTWRFSLVLAEYPTDSGAEVVALFSGASPFAIQATPEDGQWKFERAANAANPPTPGPYRLNIRATLDGVAMTLHEAKVQILADPAATEATDPRSALHRMLDACEEALAALLSGTKSSVSFGDQTYTQADAEKLMNIRDRLRTEVLKTEGRAVRRIRVRFP